MKNRKAMEINTLLYAVIALVFLAIMIAIIMVLSEGTTGQALCDRVPWLLRGC